MTDAMPYLLLYLAGIECPQYRDELNILSDKYNEKRPRILKRQIDYNVLMEKEKLQKEQEKAKENNKKKR